MGDNNNYYVLSSRSKEITPGEHIGTNGSVSALPEYLTIEWHNETLNIDHTAKVDVKGQLPFSVWFKLKFLPWRYDSGLLINLFDENHIELSWMLRDGSNQRPLDCGEGVIETYRERRNESLLEKKPRLCISEKDCFCSFMGFWLYEQERVNTLLKVESEKVEADTK